VETTALIDDARLLMRENGIGAVGVIDETGNLVGFLQRGKIRKRS
jgi:CBS domain-containing protein